MQVVVMIEGLVTEVLELRTLPSVGEVVTIEDTDLVVSSLSFQYMPSTDLHVPVLGLLPVTIETGQL